MIPMTDRERRTFVIEWAATIIILAVVCLAVSCIHHRINHPHTHS